MSAELILWGLGVGGFSSIGAVFLLRTLVKSGIEQAVKLNFDKHLEEYRTELEKEIEKLKLSLKNSETFFRLQLEALTKLRIILRRLMPKKRYPDMDWSEACEEIAEAFSKHADELDNYLCSHAAVLPKEILVLIEEAAVTAMEGTFQFYMNPDMGAPSPTTEGIKSAETLYELVEKAVGKLQKTVDLQVEALN